MVVVVVSIVVVVVEEEEYMIAFLVKIPERIMI